MKQLLYFLFFCCSQSLLGQDFYLQLQAENDAKTQLLDSLQTEKKFKTVALLLENQQQMKKNLVQMGYFDVYLVSQSKPNDSTFVLHFALGKVLKTCKINLQNTNKEALQLLDLEQDTLRIPTQNVSSFLQESLEKLEKKGYLLASLQLQNLSKKQTFLTADLDVQLQKPRAITHLELVGYPTFPRGIRKALLKKAQKKVMNQANLDEIYQSFSKLAFVNQLKYPEILFTKDSTKVFVYLEKSKPNRFDGYLGFANDPEQKLVFNGYLDLQLQNILNKGEQFHLYWKNDGNKQTSFQLGAELPYLLQSPMGLKTNLRLFKQDSLFQNTNLELQLGYYFSYNSKLFAGIQQTNSVAIQKTNALVVYDFSNSFFTSSFEYWNPNLESQIFREKTRILAKIGVGSRTYLDAARDQYFIQLEWSHQFQWHSKHSFYFRQHNYLLKSATYISNELYRFGGILSLRGFRENSLQANFFSGLMTEYRFLVASNLYLHSIFDYGWQEDATMGLQTKLVGLGFGFGIFTKNGLFNLVYANGSNENNALKISNSMVQISFKSRF